MKPSSTAESFAALVPFLRDSPPLEGLDGYVHPDFLPVADLLRKQLASTGAGTALCVYHHGEPVVDLWGGVRDRAGRPWQRDTMAPCFSTTKGVVATAVHVLVDQGLVDYDDPLAKYWPEFAQEGKERITLRHVLTHQAGLYHIRKMIDRADRMLDWRYVTQAIERARPIHPPGERTGYHGLTFGYLLGELVQRVTGQTFSRVVEERIAQPIGADGLFIGAPRPILHRAAELVPMRRMLLAPQMAKLAGAWLDLGVAVALGSVTRPFLRALGFDFDLESVLDALAPDGIDTFDFGAHDTLQALIPAANGLFTARSLARMYAALANGGRIDGARLLSPRTLARATERQVAPNERCVIPFDMRWRLGYHGVLTSRGIPRRAFGHFGYGGSGAWAEPNRDLAMALIVNGGHGTPFGDMRIVRMSGTVLACADARAHRAPRRSRSPRALPAAARCPRRLARRASGRRPERELAAVQ